MKPKLTLITTALCALFGASALLPASAAPVRLIAPLSATQSVDFLVHLPLRNSAQLDQLIRAQSDRSSPTYHHFLTPAAFHAAYGPTPATIASVVAALKAHGIGVVRVDSQIIHARGPAAQVQRTFATQLNVVRDATGRTSVAAVRKPTVPMELSRSGATIAGLATTIHPKPLFKRSRNAAPQNRTSPFGGYWFDDLKQAYSYPSYATANGTGVTIATVGESDYSTDDANAYFGHEQLASGGLAPAPTLERALLPGAAAFDPNSGASDEADLDVQMAGGSAPGATIVGVAVSGPGEPFLEAYSYLDEADYADIISTSYGECELYYTAPYNNGQDYTDVLQSYHDLFRQGNAEGITYVFSSGDDSGVGCYPTAYFGPGTGKTYYPIPGAGIWVDDPNVTGVGGTNLKTTFTSGSLTSKYVSENEVGDEVVTPVDYYGTGNYVYGLWGSGGGVSTVFAKPAYQNLVATGASTRTDPDISMHMGGCPYYGPNVTVLCDPNRDSYDLAVIGGQLAGLIGTSASAPEFAGLLAVAASSLHSRLGNVNPDIYAEAQAQANGTYQAFHQGIPSFNGVYHVAAGQQGYNTTVGVGTPIAKNFLLKPSAPVAGDPQTATNP